MGGVGGYTANVQDKCVADNGTWNTDSSGAARRSLSHAVPRGRPQIEALKLVPRAERNVQGAAGSL